MTVSEGFARRYRLLERIAIGGTAEVFRAHLVTDDGGRPVVIKRVLPQFARDERFRQLFLEEACLTATLAHPNIVRVLDHGEIDNTCYITLELVDGKDLGSLLSQVHRASHDLPLGVAALIVIRVAEALQFIHDHTSSEGLPLRIIHRDVSPQNILVSHQGDVKLTDFGIAKSAIRREHTVDGTLRGKLDYMSPEQATGADVDHRADIFGLGCVLYEMLVGQPPFRAETEIDTLDRLRHGELEQPPEALDLPEPLREVLVKALAADREQRYQRAGDLADDLRAFIEQQDVDDDAVGHWVRELGELPASGEPADAVDDAVRLLLGDPGDDAGAGLPTAPERPEPTATAASSHTSVFIDSAGNPAPASSATGLTPSRTSEVALPPPPSRSRWLAIPLVVLGVLGWVLFFIMVDRKATSKTNPAREAPPGGVTVKIDAGPEDSAAHEDQRAAARAPRVEAGADPSPRRTPRRRARHGYLTINSMPWSRVYLDGKFVGNTPLVRMQVSAGQRRVQLRGPRGELRRAFNASVRPGRTRSYAFDLAKRR